MTDGPYELRPIGWVESALVEREAAPKQGDEGSPDAWLAFEPFVAEGRSATLTVHPRDDPANPEQGVFSTRSPDRPNPIGCTESRSWRSRAHESVCGTSRPSTERPSST